MAAKIAPVVPMTDPDSGRFSECHRHDFRNGRVRGRSASVRNHLPINAPLVFCVVESD
jgi:hypothetical protein